MGLWKEKRGTPLAVFISISCSYPYFLIFRTLSILELHKLPYTLSNPQPLFDPLQAIARMGKVSPEPGFNVVCILIPPKQIVC